ncbi:MAG TPA: DinB family protein [Vicinamibacterales bacterium]|nr:DinB family protein [Vicinamibacterales bacterium]
MNHADLKTMVDYHYWARDRLFEALEPLTGEQYTRDLGSSFKSIRDTVTHTYAAEWAWHERWQGRSPTTLTPSDRFADLAALRAAWRESERNIRKFVDGLDDPGISRVITYKLLSGADGASPIWQMVQHVVNHATYHRGQITTMLRQSDAQPATSMDMIAFYRTRG